MHRRTSYLLVLILLASIITAQAERVGWKTYTNARFGFRLSYPGFLEASREPDNGAGQEFHTASGDFSVVAQGHFLQVDDGDSLDTRWQEELRTRGKTITYQRKAPTWYVVSGVLPDGTEYYYKLHVQGGNWASLHITYPHSKNAEYDPWVARMSKEFVPFLRGDYDRLEK